MDIEQTEFAFAIERYYISVLDNKSFYVSIIILSEENYFTTQSNLTNDNSIGIITYYSLFKSLLTQVFGQFNKIKGGEMVWN